MFFIIDITASATAAAAVAVAANMMANIIIVVYIGQTPGQFGDHPEKRTPIAFEILASEQEYMRTLKAISEVYVRPLKSALSSKR